MSHKNELLTKTMVGVSKVPLNNILADTRKKKKKKKKGKKSLKYSKCLTNLPLSVMPLILIKIDKKIEILTI